MSWSCWWKWRNNSMLIKQAISHKSRPSAKPSCYLSCWATPGGSTAKSWRGGIHRDISYSECFPSISSSSLAWSSPVELTWCHIWCFGMLSRKPASASLPPSLSYFFVKMWLIIILIFISLLLPLQMEPVVVQASRGEPLGAVAERAGIEIKYKCKKGECGTCEVNIGGKWVKTCQTSVTAPSDGDSLKVNVKTYLQVKKKSAEFFSPMSFVEGVVNNGLGVVGFVQKGLQVCTFSQIWCGWSMLGWRWVRLSHEAGSWLSCQSGGSQTSEENGRATVELQWSIRQFWLDVTWDFTHK